jgi:ABC-type dipeptide/oligopeptide/nickel transport system ATPase component
MNIIANLVRMIKQGKQGKNKGLPTGFSRLDKITYGIQRKYITVIAGDSGSGKSSLALYMYVYRPLMEAITNNKDVNILYFSFEMSSEILLAKLLSIYIWEMYYRHISYEQILSLTTEISDEDYDYIKRSISWLQIIEQKMTIIDKPVSSKGVYAITRQWTERFGTYKEINEHKTEYIPNNPDQYLIGLIDHMRLLSGGDGTTTKSKIDDCCDYCVSLRNRTSMSWCFVIQLNRGFKSMERRSGGYQLLQLDDMADSSSPAQSAEIVLGIFDAYREKMKNCEGYKVDQMMDSFRLLQVLKNRFGLSNKNVGLAFYGAIGLWKELPRPNEINNYSKYSQLELQLNTNEENLDQSVNKSDQTGYTFTF